MDLMEVERLVQDVEETDGDVNTEDVIQLSSLREDDGVFRATLSHLLRNVYKTVREENSLTRSLVIRLSINSRIVNN